MVSADFTVNGAENPAAHSVTYGATVALALKSFVGVTSIEWTIESISEPGEAVPVVTAAGSPYGATASFAMVSNPGDGRGRSVLVKCIVNGPRGSDTQRAIVGVPNTAGRIPVAPGESTERDATHGWLTAVNDALNAGDSSIQVTVLVAAKAAATVNISSLSGPQTLDGISCVAGDRVFLAYQSTQSQNGPWVVQAGAWTRPSDFNDSADIISGQTIIVTQGSTLGGTQWALVSQGPFTLGSTALVWAQLGGSGGTAVGIIAPVDVVATTIVNTSSPGSAIDGVTLSVGNRVLLTAQSPASANGVYTFNGSASALTRSADCDADGDLRIGQQIRVKSGTLGTSTIWELATGSTIAGSKTYKKLTNATDKVNHDVLWDYEIHVGPPSGDTTGATDSANFAAAIARAYTLANAVRSGLRMRIAVGVGHYYINSFITVTLLVRFGLIGVGARCTTIEYVGPRIAGRAMLEMDSCIGCRVEGIEFIGNRVERMVRSVFAPGQPNGNKFIDCHFYGVNPYNGSSAVIGTSTTSVSIGGGSKVFTVTAAAGVTLSDVLVNGSKAGAFSRSTGKFVWGTVALSGTTLTLTVSTIRQRDFRGSGSANDWDICIPPEGLYLTDANSLTQHCWFSRLFFGWFADGSFNSSALDNWYDTNAIFGWTHIIGTGASACRIRGASEWSAYGWSNFAFAGTSLKCHIEHNTGDGGIEGECIRADFALNLTISGDFYAGSISGTSTSSVAIGTGSKTFTIQASQYLPNGTPINFVSGANAMSGLTTAYNSTTGVVTANITSVSGSGTFSSWTWDARPNRSAAIVANGTEKLKATHAFFSYDCYLDFDTVANGAAYNIDPHLYHLKPFGGASTFWRGDALGGDDYRIQDNADGRVWYAKIRHDEAKLGFIVGCNRADIAELKTGNVPSLGASATYGIWTDAGGNRLFGAQYFVPAAAVLPTIGGVCTDIESRGGIVNVTGPTNPFEIHGFLQGYPGHFFLWRNLSGQVCTFKNQSTTELVAQRRIITPNSGDYADNGAGIAICVYGDDSRFRIVPLYGFAPSDSGATATRGYVDALAYLSVGAGASLVKSGATLTRAALTGDVTASADSNATTIANGAVTSAKLATAVASSINAPHIYEWVNKPAPGGSIAPWISKIPTESAAATAFRVVSERIVGADFTANYFAFSCLNALATDNFTATVYKNGVATALTFTVNAGVTTGTDSSHSVAFSRGDKMAISCVQTGSEAQASWYGTFVVSGG